MKPTRTHVYCGLLTLGLLSSLALSVTACGGGGYSSSGGGYSGSGGASTTPPANSVYVGTGGYSPSMSYFPPTLTVPAGTTVTWIFREGPHSVTSGTPGAPDGKFDSGSLSTGTFTHMFTTAGTYPYYCTVHGAMMTGTITVN